MIATALVVAALAATPCAGLKSISLPNTTITSAELVPAGSFKPPAQAAPAAAAPASQRGSGRGQGPGGGAPQQTALTVPAFCRVAATLKPSSDSEIHIEVW